MVSGSIGRAVLSRTQLVQNAEKNWEKTFRGSVCKGFSGNKWRP